MLKLLALTRCLGLHASSSAHPTPPCVAIFRGFRFGFFVTAARIRLGIAAAAVIVIRALSFEELLKFSVICHWITLQ
jgi:hypothetical protein